MNPLRFPSFRKRLLAWFRREGRDLPWRKDRTAYRVWVSEVMLQQTRVSVVIPYFERWTAELPDLPALAKAPMERVMKLWEGLGYYRRARFLKEGAEQVMASGGEFPSTYEGIAEVKGVGPYTAAAIASLAYGLPKAVVDGNVERVLSRLFAFRTTLDSAAGKAWAQETADALLDRRHPGPFNEALMELGALTCLPALPRCDDCPVAEDCEARARGLEDSLPLRKKAPKAVPVERAALVVVDGAGRILLHRRPTGGWMAGLWEFPSVRCDGREGDRVALEWLRREAGLKLRIVKKEGELVYSVTTHRVREGLWLARTVGSGDVSRRERATGVRANEGDSDSPWLWVDPPGLARFAMPAAQARWRDEAFGGDVAGRRSSGLA